MSKKQHRRKFVGQMKQSQEPKMYSPEWTASHAKRAMDYLAPHIRSKNLPPGEAIVLSALTVLHNIKGKNGEVAATNEEIHQTTNLILALWNEGLFKPCEAYPYTLEETLARVKADNEESEAAE